jgi:hypothetical protein
MDLRDATLVFLTESAGHPSVERLAQAVHDELSWGGEVPHEQLSELIGEASGKGILRAMSRKYSPTAYEAIIMPILGEIGRRAPIRSNRLRSTATL